MNQDAQYAAYREMVETGLARAMEASSAPEPLRGAMAYSLLAGGKRLRPVMLLAAYEMAGGNAADVLPYACALEMIHVYSLVHDDLPAMDDDDLRRGRPTNHKVYGEGMAVLAGDGLLSLAFETMLESADSGRAVAAMRRIARAAGVDGMVAGQCVDLRSEADGTADADTLDYIHRHKTADLFIGAVTAGLLLGGATAEEVDAGEAYALALGTAFQIRDDLLDLEGDAALLGKATGMDAARGKLTWPGLHGVQAAREAVALRTQEALDALTCFAGRADFLCTLATCLLERDH